MADLDTILSGKGASASEPAPAASPANPEPQAEPAQPRDDHGRFAGKEGAAPENPEAPATPELTDGKKQSDAQPHAPVAAVTAERAKRQDAEQRLAQVEAELKEMRRQSAPKPQAPAAPETPPDWFANPDEAFKHRAQEVINPVQQSLMFNARLIAEQVNGADAVANAVEAFDAAVAAGKVDPTERQRIMSSPNPFHDAVHWLKRQQTLAEVGEDPAAYRERIRAEVLAELQGQGKQPATPAQPVATTPAPVMPSNLANARSVGARSGPAWGGPATLKDIFDRRPGK
jgi:hypothetical protein